MRRIDWGWCLLSFYYENNLGLPRGYVVDKDFLPLR